MARIKSTLTAKSGDGESNAAEWKRLVDELNQRRRAAAEGGSRRARERHVGRGKLLTRERVAGLIGGREAMIIANDPTIKGGAYYPMTVKKHLRAQEVAAENRLPCVYLVDS